MVPVYIMKVHGARYTAQNLQQKVHGTRRKVHGTREHGEQKQTLYLSPCTVRRAPCTILQKLMRVEFSEIPT